jgi:hypothetical protein
VSQAAVAEAPPVFGNQAEFAAAHAWSKSYVSKLKAEGRLVFAADGLVDFGASLARIKATSGAPERAAAPVQGDAYANAQDRERHYSAELKRLELERETRKLLPADEVYAALDDAGTIVRAGVEAWRDRLPPQLAAAGSDEQRIAALLAGECESLLQRLAQRFAALAAQGAAA